ncbi:MAG: hypothetical protein HOK41_15160 [Nitrospina sp.]|jgi:predicted metal-binding protein|nr:hypothetical protein [Nitrospina sp.]MBT6716051.1 hypothetical protein [Nitrospina sp.]
MASKIKICTGAGCKAWNSEYMASKLKQLQGSDDVCLVPCMKQCGGGASVRLKNRGKVLKLRETEDVAYLLNSNSGALAAVC